MSVEYKINVMQALKEAGYSSTRLRNDKIIGEATMQRLRHKQSVSYEVLGKICELLQCQVGDVLEYIPDNTKEPKEE